jgi:cytochrome c-type biogenesis protein
MDHVSIPFAFIAGLISFLSPCVLPLVPGYMSIISGFSLDQIRDAKDPKLTQVVVKNSAMFIAGFSITLITLGASATWLGQVLASERKLIEYGAGTAIVIFGLHLIGIFRINFLYRDKRFHGLRSGRGTWGAMLLGFAFAFGWSPCLGPILAGILTLAMTESTLNQGVLLLAVYSLGLGLPFFLTSLGLNQFLQFYSRFKRHFRALELTSGVLVITVGVMILTNSMSRFNGYLSFLNRFVLNLENSLF